MPKKQKANKALQISRMWQLLFIGAVLFTWLSSIGVMFMWSYGNSFNSSFWYAQLTYTVIPLLFLLASLMYVLPRYTAKLHRLFMAVFIALIGVTTYSAVSLIENTIRYKYFPPSFTDTNDTSLLTAFGHEWLIMGICLTLFSLGLYWISKRAKA